eukprot:gene24284-biopygen16409
MGKVSFPTPPLKGVFSGDLAATQRITSKCDAATRLYWHRVVSLPLHLCILLRFSWSGATSSRGAAGMPAQHSQLPVCAQLKTCRWSAAEQHRGIPPRHWRPLRKNAPDSRPIRRPDADRAGAEFLPQLVHGLWLHVPADFPQLCCRPLACQSADSSCAAAHCRVRAWHCTGRLRIYGQISPVCGRRTLQPNSPRPRRAFCVTGCSPRLFRSTTRFYRVCPWSPCIPVDRGDPMEPGGAQESTHRRVENAAWRGGCWCVGKSQVLVPSSPPPLFRVQSAWKCGLKSPPRSHPPLQRHSRSQQKRRLRYSGENVRLGHDKGVLEFAKIVAKYQNVWNPPKNIPRDSFPGE